MGNEVILVFPKRDSLGAEYRSIKAAEELFIRVSGGRAFDRWVVKHLGIDFHVVFPSPTDENDFEIKKRILKAIHRWALEE